MGQKVLEDVFEILDQSAWPVCVVLGQLYDLFETVSKVEGLKEAFDLGEDVVQVLLDLGEKMEEEVFFAGQLKVWEQSVPKDGVDFFEAQEGAGQFHVAGKVKAHVAEGAVAVEFQPVLETVGVKLVWAGGDGHETVVAAKGTASFFLFGGNVGRVPCERQVSDELDKASALVVYDLAEQQGRVFKRGRLVDVGEQGISLLEGVLKQLEHDWRRENERGGIYPIREPMGELDTRTNGNSNFFRKLFFGPNTYSLEEQS